jgi:hypothetical protein
MERSSGLGFIAFLPPPTPSPVFMWGWWIEKTEGRREGDRDIRSSGSRASGEQNIRELVDLRLTRWKKRWFGVDGLESFG